MSYWYDDIERVLDDLSKGNIDSTVAIELLTDLGYSRQVVIEDILCGHDE
tara:strand:+ start:381 stop:530 length:150 start_codon:yes stop_codon:yes gene_type:complete